MPREVHKAVCYVVHDDHMLVFTHRDVPLTVTGVQVPAGTIKLGESPEQAAVRELFEETGRRGHVVRPVGLQRYDLRPVRDEVAVRHYFRMAMPGADVTERWSAGESDPATGGPVVVWDCWWLPIAEAHVLAAGLGGLLGTMLEEMSLCERTRTLE
ncbi:NUDIX domain-containing protein [Rhodococcus sp. R1101]|uniref:NUDIX domain-containing protein n=1 Tax=Rhodococcus sp. R1101 TaxID=1170698 RepID=UPI00030DD84F|nr:NUDIX domain-containing protein [Rhodococcus sp. R1101]